MEGERTFAAAGRKALLLRAAGLSLALGWLSVCGKVEDDHEPIAQGGQASAGFTSSSDGAGSAAVGGSPATNGGALASGGSAGMGSALGSASSGCFYGSPSRQPLCDRALHLSVQKVSGTCRFAIHDAPAAELMAGVLAEDLMIAFTLNSGEGREVVPRLLGDEASCSARLEDKRPAWYLNYDANPVEIGLCSCSCERLESVGTLDVIFGCGGGPVYTG